jgi:hypothetical protein
MLDIEKAISMAVKALQACYECEIYLDDGDSEKEGTTRKNFRERAMFFEMHFQNNYNVSIVDRSEEIKKMLKGELVV